MKAIERKVQPNIVVPAKASPELKAFAGSMIAAHKQLAEAYNRSDDDMQQALRGGVSSQNNIKVVHRDLLITMPLDAPWLAMTPQGAWVAVAGSQAPQVLMEPGGHVYTRGVIDTGVSGTVAATPGNGYGPPAATMLPCGSDAAARLNIAATTGAMTVTGAGTVFSLEAHWIASMPAASGQLVTRPHPFTGLGWPIIIEHGFDRALACEVVACKDASATSGTSGAPVPDWEDIGSGHLRLNGLWGLQWGRRYSVRLRITKET